MVGERLNSHFQSSTRPNLLSNWASSSLNDSRSPNCGSLAVALLPRVLFFFLMYPFGGQQRSIYAPERQRRARGPPFRCGPPNLLPEVGPDEHVHTNGEVEDGYHYPAIRAGPSLSSSSKRGTYK